MTQNALTIGGSDSGGGAGIQADLKTFAAHGVYGTSVVTAVTAQNTTGVQAVHDVPPEIISAQIHAVMSDIGTQAIKSGMLSNAMVIDAVADALDQYQGLPYVLDPVMVSTRGDRLLAEDALTALTAKLISIAHLVTPTLD